MFEIENYQKLDYLRVNELSLFCNLSMDFCLECILFLPVRSYSNNYFSYYNTQHDRLFREIQYTTVIGDKHQKRVV